MFTARRLNRGHAQQFDGEQAGGINKSGTRCKLRKCQGRHGCLCNYGAKDKREREDFAKSKRITYKDKPARPDLMLSRRKFMAEQQVSQFNASQEHLDQVGHDGDGAGGVEYDDHDFDFDAELAKINTGQDSYEYQEAEDSWYQRRLADEQRREAVQQMRRLPQRLKFKKLLQNHGHEMHEDMARYLMQGLR